MSNKTLRGDFLDLELSLSNSTYNLFVLSSNDDACLKQLSQEKVDNLQLTCSKDLKLHDMCYNSAMYRPNNLASRLAIVAQSKQEIEDSLQDFVSNKSSFNLFNGKTSVDSDQIVFLFTGQGSQYINMGIELYKTQKDFRAILDKCSEIASSYLDRSLLSLIFSKNSNDTSINETYNTQPALFAFEYALAKFWIERGVKPDFLIGHSVGEYAAACIAGVFELEDGLRLITTRGKLISSLASDIPGGMFSVLAEENYVANVIDLYRNQVSIAAVNGPKSVVIAGEMSSLLKIVDIFTNQGIKTYKLNVSHAFHSPLMEPVLERFLRFAESISYSSAQIPIVSNVYGKVVDSNIYTPYYWVKHMRGSVKFYDSISFLSNLGCSIFLEVGPKPILINLVAACFNKNNKLLKLLPSVFPKDELQTLLNTLAELYTLGINIDWDVFYKNLYFRN